MEWVTQATDFVSQNWDKILLWVTTPVVSGLSVWQLFKLIITIIRNFTAKRYSKPLEAKYNELKAQIDNFVNQVNELFKEEVKQFSLDMQEQFNNVMLNYTNQKQAIYDKLVLGKVIKKEEIPEEKIVLVENTTKNTPNLNETEKVEEIIEETEIVEEKAKNGDILI